MGTKQVPEREQPAPDQERDRAEEHHLDEDIQKQGHVRLLATVADQVIDPVVSLEEDGGGRRPQLPAAL
jgi:hypothetical protein